MSADTMPGPSADAEIVMFFVGDDGEPLDPWAPEDRDRDEGLESVPVEPGGLPAATVAAFAHPPVPPSRPWGPRPARWRHQGCAEEVRVPVLGQPRVVTAVAVRSGLLGRSTGDLDVDLDTAVADYGCVTWAASLRQSAGRRRPASLRMYGSPSGVVTLCVLTPLHPRVRPSRSFLRAGLSAVMALRDGLVVELRGSSTAGVNERGEITGTSHGAGGGNERRSAYLRSGACSS